MSFVVRAATQVFQVTMRNAGPQAFTASAAAAAALERVSAELKAQNCDAYVLLCGIGSLFARDLVTFEEAADRARPKDRLNLCRNSSMVISGDASSRATIVAW